MLFYPLYYNIISLTSVKIIQALHLLLGCAENEGNFWDFIFQQLSDNRGTNQVVSSQLAMQLHRLLGKCCCKFMQLYHICIHANKCIIGMNLAIVNAHISTDQARFNSHKGKSLCSQTQYISLLKECLTLICIPSMTLEEQSSKYVGLISCLV